MPYLCCLYGNFLQKRLKKTREREEVTENIELRVESICRRGEASEGVVKCRRKCWTVYMQEGAEKALPQKFADTEKRHEKLNTEIRCCIFTKEMQKGRPQNTWPERNDSSK